MANPTDDPTENTPVSTGSSIDGNAETEESPDERKYDHTDEVPALLGIVEGSVDKEQVIVPDQEEAVHDAAPAEVVDAGDEAAVNAEAKAAEATTAMDSFQVQPESPIIPEITIAQENRDEVLPADVADLKDIMAALQESLTNSRYISAKIDAVSIDTDCLIKQVNGISNSGDLLAAEIEAINSGAKTKSILSKTFLTCSSAVLALLIIIQFYMFTGL